MAESLHVPEVTLTAVLSEVRSVKDGCSRRTNIVEQVRAHHVDALKAEWSHMTAELIAKQNGMVNRVGRIEGHLSQFASDQNNALESNQTTWRDIQELKSRAAEMNARMVSFAGSAARLQPPPKTPLAQDVENIKTKRGFLTPKWSMTRTVIIFPEIFKNFNAVVVFEGPEAATLLIFEPLALIAFGAKGKWVCFRLPPNLAVALLGFSIDLG